MELIGRRCRILLLWGAWSLPCAVWAASPSIESVSPAVGQRGTRFQFKLVGAGLKDASEVMLYSPGVTCRAIESVNENELQITLDAAGDCLLGTHSFRVRTSQGISELRAFRITPFPVVVAEEPNENFDQAKPAGHNVTIVGVLESADLDCFRVRLARGERLAAEVEAVRLGASMLDTVLTVYGPDGKPLATVDDTPLFHQDPFVSLVAPIDGDYVVEVRETNLEGDDNSRYALHVGTFPRPAFVYPAGGPAGQRVNLRVCGDAGGPWEQEVQLPSTENDFPLFVERAGFTTPTPNPLRVSPFPNVLESEPNDDSANGEAKAVDLPVAFNGILDHAGDVDCFRFKSSSGVPFQFEVFAARIGSPVDTVLSIVDENGKLLAANDDDETHDSRLVFVARSDAELTLRIADKRGSGGEGCVYRVEAFQPSQRLSAFLPRPNRLSQERQTICVPRGNRVAAMLAVQRQNLRGDVRLQFEGLPEGVAAPEVTVPSDRYWIPVVFEAKPDAALAGSLADVLATAETDGKPVIGHFTQVVDLVAGSADALFQSTTVDRLAVAVVDAAPLTVSLETPEATLVQDGTIGLIVRVDRTANFEGPVDVTLPFLPPWLDGPPKISIPTGASTGIYPLRAFPQAEARTWQLCAEAKAGTSAPANPAMEPMFGQPMYRRSRRSRPSADTDVAVASPLVPLRVSAASITGTFALVATEPGKSVPVVCELKRTGDLPEQLTATLEGLPNRVHASPVTIDRDDARVTFSITVEPTAPIGSFTSLVCRLSGVMDGQEVSQCVGRGGTLRIEPPGKLATDDSGRVLSPLEALRRSQQKGQGM